MGGFFPHPHQMMDFAIWLLGGMAIATITGVVVGLMARTRREAWLLGFLIGLVGAGLTLTVSMPFGGGLWAMWTVIGALMAAGLATGWALFVSFVRRRRKEASSGSPATPL